MLPNKLLNVSMLLGCAQILAQKRQLDKVSLDLKVCRDKLATRDKQLQVLYVSELLCS